MAKKPTSHWTDPLEGEGGPAGRVGPINQGTRGPRYEGGGRDSFNTSPAERLRMRSRGVQTSPFGVSRMWEDTSYVTASSRHRGRKTQGQIKEQ